MYLGRCLQLFVLLLFSLMLTGCMVGPNFHALQAPPVDRYTEAPAPVKTVSIPKLKSAGKAQRFILGEDIMGEWWMVFHSPEINYLIQRGLLNSPNLAAAKATLIQAQENMNAQVGSLLPSVAANFTGQRQRFSSSSFGTSTPVTQIFNLFNASVAVSYTLDVFGGLRRQLESLAAQADAEKFELDAAYLTLTANIVTTSITIASLRAQIDATHELIRSQEDQLSIVRNQFRLGGASRADVLSQETQVAQTRATLPPLEQSLVQNFHALSVLIGEYPSEDKLPHFNLNKLRLPEQLPISLPSLLARQRPDVQAAEALLHVASANIGVATANLYPQITLTGNYGWQGNVLSSLINPNNIVWNVGTAITQPIFNGGALMAKKRAAVAAFQQAAAQYRQTVLTAFQNVADTLRALQHDAEALRDQREAEIAAQRALVLTREQYRLGGVSYLNLLNAERQYQQTRISRIQAQAARFTDTAALFQALGGGWWNRPSLDCSADLCRNLSQYTPERFNG